MLLCSAHAVNIDWLLEHVGQIALHLLLHTFLLHASSGRNRYGWVVGLVRANVRIVESGPKGLRHIASELVLCITPLVVRCVEGVPLFDCPVLRHAPQPLLQLDGIYDLLIELDLAFEVFPVSLLSVSLLLDDVVVDGDLGLLGLEGRSHGLL